MKEAHAAPLPSPRRAGTGRRLSEPSCPPRGRTGKTAASVVAAPWPIRYRGAIGQAMTPPWDGVVVRAEGDLSPALSTGRRHRTSSPVHDLQGGVAPKELHDMFSSSNAPRWTARGARAAHGEAVSPVQIRSSIPHSPSADSSRRLAVFQARDARSAHAGRVLRHSGAIIGGFFTVPGGPRIHMSFAVSASVVMVAPG